MSAYGHVLNPDLSMQIIEDPGSLKRIILIISLPFNGSCFL